MPDDVTAMARKYANEWKREWEHCWGSYTALIKAFEATIIAERERCAKVVSEIESPFDRYSHSPENGAYCNALDAAEAAIRSIGAEGGGDA